LLWRIVCALLHALLDQSGVVMHDEPFVWERVEWRQGDGRYVFEVAQGGLHATLRSPHGAGLTLPVIAWEGLLDALTAARRTRSRNERRDLPARSGARWTAIEAGELRAAFEAGASVAALAEAHNRTLVAIEMQLAQLGLVDRLPGGSARSRGTGRRPVIPPDWPPDPPKVRHVAPDGRSAPSPQPRTSG
jgi:hypothetical protein